MRTLALAFGFALLSAGHTSSSTVVEKRYTNGQLAEVRMYSRGEKTGVHRGWWPNGVKQFECEFNDGRAIGSCREWYSDGRLATIHRFENGKESGLQQGWSPTGAVQFSYAMRNGRRYGLLGSMSCKTGARAPGEL